MPWVKSRAGTLMSLLSLLGRRLNLVLKTIHRKTALFIDAVMPQVRKNSREGGDRESESDQLDVSRKVFYLLNSS